MRAKYPRRSGGELKKGKFTHVRYRFSLVKARRKLLPWVTDRGLNDMRCFRGGFTLGVHKIPFLEFSPFTQAGQEQLKQSYKKLVALTQGVKVQADAVMKALNDGQLVVRREAFLQVVAAESSLKHYLPLVEKVITQTQARIFQAQTRHPDK